MSSSMLSLALGLPLLVASSFALFVVYLIIQYTPIIMRIFEETPMFLPLRVPPRSDGEEVRFTTIDGLELVGTYFSARNTERVGVLVFCHEFLSNRWSYQPYADNLRDLGFDIFTFDFRNHGVSDSDRVYKPLQWVSDHEVHDLQAALRALRSRPDHDPAGFGLYGISKGGGTALVVASGEPDVWGVITDGAFPTRGMMMSYILRWAQIFVPNRVMYSLLRDFAPTKVFGLLSWVARLREQRKLSCKFPDIETAVARLSPRPLLMIHGAKDAYIKPDIARSLFDEGREPKELWIVPGAKHNRCREVEPETYAERIKAFFRKNSPRPLLSPALHSRDETPNLPPGVGPSDAPEAIASTVSHSSRAQEVSMPEESPSLSGGLPATVPG